jgi:hypothetical protein
VHITFCWSQIDKRACRINKEIQEKPVSFWIDRQCDKEVEHSVCSKQNGFRQRSPNSLSLYILLLQLLSVARRWLSWPGTHISLSHCYARENTSCLDRQCHWIAQQSFRLCSRLSFSGLATTIIQDPTTLIRSCWEIYPGFHGRTSYP